MLHKNWSESSLHYLFSKNVANGKFLIKDFFTFLKIVFKSLSINVNTTMQLHHMDFNKMLGEKARKEPHKDAELCFEQTPKAATYKISTTWQFMSTSHFTNCPSKISKICWRSKDKLLC